MQAFATRLLRWWERNGRHDLPWQDPRSPYRVWLSEVMLQQTRVESVVPYFLRFLERFPTLESLAAAEPDDVLARWSGLGYYARARNLHACARLVVDRHGGRFPDDPGVLAGLPGIGPSTANAIVAQAFDRRAPILDGNAKRVLARHAGIEGWPGRRAVEKALWQAADERTPSRRAADYTQAIMDLGATICTPRRPDCGACPVSADCAARQAGREQELPHPRPRREVPQRSQRFALAIDGNRVLLVRRPPSGIWGGLWCLPLLESVDSGDDAEEVLDPLQHAFTHFRLEMRFVGVDADRAGRGVADDADFRWMTPEEWSAAGLPRPVRTALDSLVQDDSGSPALRLAARAR